MGNAALAKEGAELGGGGAETPSGDGVVGLLGDGVVELLGDGVVGLEGGGVEPVEEGPGAGAGLEEGLEVDGEGLDAGGRAAVPVTLMANFWPAEQWPVKVQIYKCSPAVVRVILAGLAVIRVLVAEVLQES